MNENNQFNQPVGQNNMNPGYVQPQPMPKNNNKNTIIYVAIFVVAFVIGFIAVKGFGGKSQIGEWDCGNIQLKIEKNKVTLKQGSIEVTEKYTTPRGKANEKSKKSGYTYKNYEIKNAKVGTRTMDLGFTFGVSKDGKEGHYIDGLNQIIQTQYTCKKK